MRIFLVGVFVDAKNSSKIVGYRMLEADSKKIQDVSVSKCIECLRKGLKIENLKLHNVSRYTYEVKGVNGSISRYGIVGKTHALVILNEIHSKGELIGYVCSDTLGNVRALTDKEAFRLASTVGIANGKVVQDHISAIEGSYPVLKGTTTLVNTNIPKIGSNLKNNKAQQEQIKKVALAEEKEKKATAEAKPAQVKPVEQPIKKEETQQKQEQQSVNLKFIKMKAGQAYVAGLSDINYSGDVLIPSECIINGERLGVAGIKLRAFAGTKITGVTLGANISDIGQGAFDDCEKLVNVNMGAARNEHIPMNCFNGCVHLINVQLGNRVQRIHEQAFKDCKMLETINLPLSAEIVASSAFENCYRLKEVSGNIKYVNEGAFRSCFRLKEFNFNNVNSIGAQAFRLTGFEKLTLPGNIATIGRKAFSDCYALKTLVLEEGIKEIGEYAFASSTVKSLIHKGLPNEIFELIKYKDCPIENIKTAKSIEKVEADIFRNAEMVEVYTGSACESCCIAYNTPYVNIDAVDKENSTTARIKSAIFSTNPVETLHEVISTRQENASNKEDFILETNKLVDIELGEQNFKFFGIEKSTEEVEPTMKFKGAVNYLQDISSLYTNPLANGVLRAQDMYITKSTEVFNDGCNKIIKLTYFIKDTLENGSIMLVIMNNHLKFVTDCNQYTDIEMRDFNETDRPIYIKTYLHIGDTLGQQGTFSGHPAEIIIEPNEENGLMRRKRINVGEEVLNLLEDLGIIIKASSKDMYIYEPIEQIVIRLHDGRVKAANNKIAEGSKDCLNLTEMLDYNDFVKKVIELKKKDQASINFFRDIEGLSDREVERKSTNLKYVQEEKETQLFQVSKAFVQIIGDNKELVSPNKFTPEIFKELSKSYWIVPKDLDWLNQTGKKSLNKTAEYNIGNIRVIEYKSNQVVKFSNPYMNGQKGAYVFTASINGHPYGVYASRYSLSAIANMLYDLTYISNEDKMGIIDLMKNPNVYDEVPSGLFYRFYNVLETKNNWGLSSFLPSYQASTIQDIYCNFTISMYKPTGIFYLVMTTFRKKQSYDSKAKKQIEFNTLVNIPLFPIGSMDRALMVANTTNINSRKTNLLKELATLAIMQLINLGNLTSSQRYRYNYIAESLSKNKDFDTSICDKYIEARKLIIEGEKQTSKYLELIDSRAVYMLGTVHKGKLLRERDLEDSEEGYNEEAENILEDGYDIDSEYEGYEDEEEDDELDDIIDELNDILDEDDEEEYEEDYFDEEE